MLIKEIYRKLRVGHKATSEDYLNYLRSVGMSTGEDVFCAQLKTLLNYLNKNKVMFSLFEEFSVYFDEK